MSLCGARAGVARLGCVAAVLPAGAGMVTGFPFGWERAIALLPGLACLP